VSLAREILSDLRKMFLADAGLAAGVAALVALAGALIRLAGWPPLTVGALFTLACLALFFRSVVAEAARRR
jgi:hypothetical protein